jgi:hypothetical protein
LIFRTSLCSATMLFQISKRNIFVDIQSFHLMKNTMWTRWNGFITKKPFRRNRTYRGLLFPCNVPAQMMCVYATKYQDLSEWCLACHAPDGIPVSLMQWIMPIIFDFRPFRNVESNVWKISIIWFFTKDIDDGADGNWLSADYRSIKPYFLLVFKPLYGFHLFFCWSFSKLITCPKSSLLVRGTFWKLF